MLVKGYKINIEPFKILKEEQIEEIHKATITVLKETGIKTDNKMALKLFEKNDCMVDYERNTAKIPESLIEDCLKKVPNSFLVRARESDNDLVIDENTLYFCPLPGQDIVDIETGDRRSATREEYELGVKILDALETVHIIPWYTPYFGFRGISPVMAMLEGLALRIKNSTKVTGEGYSNDSEIYSIKMAKEIGMDLMSFMSVAPPLTWYKNAPDAALRFINADFPLIAGQATGIYGATYPCTVAGASVIGNAETMAGVVLSQLLKPGSKNIVLDFSFPVNMRSGAPFFGNIASSLHSAIFTQLWKYRYKVPVAIAPCYTNSKVSDFQTGYEKSIPAFTAAVSGANLIFLHGGIYGELTYNPIQSVLDNDIAGMIGRFIEGVTINKETLAAELINEIGPLPGSYLGEMHTRTWWKFEQYVPKAADCLTPPEWLKKGKKVALDYAKDKMKKILESHEVKPLSEEKKEKLEHLLIEARNFFKSKGILLGE